MQNVLSENLVNPIYVHKLKHPITQADQSEHEMMSKITSEASLTETQVASNSLIMFLNEVCRMDNEITCK